MSSSGTESDLEESQDSKIDIPVEDVEDQGSDSSTDNEEGQVKEKDSNNKDKEEEEKDDKSESKENTEGSISLMRSLCCCCLIFFLGYSTLTVIIIVNNANAENDQDANNGFGGSNNYLGNSTGIGVDCTSKSYLMGDGECNDVTNTERCLFDRNDCCQSRKKKKTDLCLECECKGIDLIVEQKQEMDFTELVGYEIMDDDSTWLDEGKFWLLNVFDLVASLQLCSILCMTTPTFYNTATDRKRIVPNAWIYRTPLRKCACLYYYREVCLNHYGKERFQWKVVNDLSEGLVFQGTTDKEEEKLAVMDNTIVFITTRTSQVENCYGRVIVAGGFNYKGEHLNTFEIISLDGSGKEVKPFFGGIYMDEQDWKKILSTLFVNSGTGGMVDREMFYCGGDECYVISQEEVMKEDTKRHRDSAASISLWPLMPALFITGGEEDLLSSGEDILVDVADDTTEFVINGAAFCGPKMPIPLVGHCFFKMNESFAIIAGGSTQDHPTSLTDELSRKTFFYDIFNMTFTAGPSLKVERSGQACGVIKDKETREDIAIVAGGASDSSTEYLTSSLDRWREGVDLPKALVDAQLVSSTDKLTLYLIGGKITALDDTAQNKIYTMHCIELQCQWSLLSTRLQSSRFAMVADVFPDSISLSDDCPDDPPQDCSETGSDNAHCIICQLKSYYQIKCPYYWAEYYSDDNDTDYSDDILLDYYYDYVHRGKINDFEIKVDTNKYIFRVWWKESTIQGGRDLELWSINDTDIMDACYQSYMTSTNELNTVKLEGMYDGADCCPQFSDKWVCWQKFSYVEWEYYEHCEYTEEYEVLFGGECFEHNYY